MSGYLLNDKDIVWRIVDDEAIIIHTGTSFYYGLNKSATYVWKLMEGHPLTQDALIQLLSAQYRIDPQIAVVQLHFFLGKLLMEKLIVMEFITPEQNTALDKNAVESQAEPFEDLVLTRFEQLDQVIVSGE